MYCSSFSDAADNYGCIIETVGSDNGIFTHGCLSVIEEKYFDGFNIFYGLGYTISILLLIGSILGLMIIFNGYEITSLK